jgi:hypothetical protein
VAIYAPIFQEFQTFTVSVSDLSLSRFTLSRLGFNKKRQTGVLVRKTPICLVQNYFEVLQENSKIRIFHEDMTQINTHKWSFVYEQASHPSLIAPLRTFGMFVGTRHTELVQG